MWCLMTCGISDAALPFLRGLHGDISLVLMSCLYNVTLVLVSMSACELSHGVFAAVHFFSLECFGCFTRAHEAQRTETVPLTRQILDVSPKSPFPPPLICPVLLFFFFLRGSLSFSLFLFSLKPVVLEFSSKHESNTHLCISSTRSSWPPLCAQMPPRPAFRLELRLQTVFTASPPPAFTRREMNSF